MSTNKLFRSTCECIYRLIQNLNISNKVLPRTIHACYSTHYTCLLSTAEYCPTAFSKTWAFLWWPSVYRLLNTGQHMHCKLLEGTNNCNQFKTIFSTLNLGYGLPHPNHGFFERCMGLNFPIMLWICLSGNVIYWHWSAHRWFQSSPSIKWWIVWRLKQVWFQNKYAQNLSDVSRKTKKIPKD